MVLYFDDRPMVNKILDDAVSKLRVKAAIWKQRMSTLVMQPVNKYPKP
jgi:hypothetical protein